MLTQLRQYPLFVVAILACFTPWISSPMALIFGFLLTTFGLVPTQLPIAKITKKLLAYSIIGLGFGIHLDQALKATSDGIGIIVATIIGTLALGWLLAKRMKLDQQTGYLIASGTAICGGSAIAAVAPAINADDDKIAISLATVFVLNSVALFIFPVIGHALQLDQHTFGTWAAIAIHDTSSVVGAASAYGEQALTTATTLKLARALWIIPVAFISAIIFRSGQQKIAIPYFIVFYCVAILISDTLPQFEAIYQSVFTIAKQLLVVCLFLIGSSISVTKLKQAGSRPLIFGVTLWVIISVVSLSWILLASG